MSVARGEGAVAKGLGTKEKSTVKEKIMAKNETKGMGGWAILGIVFGSLAAVGGAVFGFIWWKRRTGGTVARHSLSFYGGNDEGREYSLI